MSLCGLLEYHWAFLCLFAVPFLCYANETLSFVEFSSTESVPGLTLSYCHVSDCLHFKWKPVLNKTHFRLQCQSGFFNISVLDWQQPLTMPLNDERPTSTSSTVASEDQSSDTESSERCDSLTSSSDVDCSRQSFTSDSSSKHNSPSCRFCFSDFFYVLFWNFIYFLFYCFPRKLYSVVFY